MRPNLIAITGPAGSGKSTVADYLIANHGFTRVKFAGPLKAMLRAVGLGDAEIEGHLKETPSALLCGKTPRWAMQSLGTEWGRNCIGADFWIRLWARTAADVLDRGGRVVVDDCRFANEADAVWSMGGKIVRLYGRGGIAGGHISESMAFGADYQVGNAEAVSGLYRSVDALLDAA